MSRPAETAFLPAALDIQETAPSPAGRAVVWTILAFFTLAIVWATFSEVDIVAVAQGRIIASGHSKIVQPLEIGTVTAIHVTEGQRVKAGEVLIELDPTSTKADVERLTKERDNAAREMTRFQQLSDWLQHEELPSASARQTGNGYLLFRQWREFEDRLNVLNHEQKKLRAKRQSAQRQVDKLEALLPIVTRRAKDQKGLAENKLLPKQQYLETEQERLGTYYDLRTQKGRVAERDVAIRELDARIGFARSEFHRQVLERLDAAERRHAAAEQELIKANSRAKARTIAAPVDGVVQQLAVHSAGAVVTPAQELMVVVPRGEALEVEAILENKDIGFVEVGQQAEIKIDTFPFTKYGTIAGEVVGLSNDAVADDRKGLVYKMRVLMERSQIQVNGKLVALSPGMTVTVEAKTGMRKMIEFFLSPLLRHSQESARER
jgi:hemolysin D